MYFRYIHSFLYLTLFVNVIVNGLHCWNTQVVMAEQHHLLSVKNVSTTLCAGFTKCLGTSIAMNEDERKRVIL